MTNLDFLKSLNVVDIARLQLRACPPAMKDDGFFHCVDMKENCLDCWIRWLTSEKK